MAAPGSPLRLLPAGQRARGVRAAALAPEAACAILNKVITRSSVGEKPGGETPFPPTRDGKDATCWRNACNAVVIAVQHPST